MSVAVAHRNRDKHSDSGRGTDRERDSDSDSDSDWDISSHNNIVTVALKVTGTSAMSTVSVIQSVSNSDRDSN